MFGEKFRQVVDAEVERLDGAMAYERERGTEELKRRAWARFTLARDPVGVSGCAFPREA
jgi:hypothetical protein